MKTRGWMLLSLLLGTAWLGCSQDFEPAPDSGTMVDGGTREDAGNTPADSGADGGTEPSDAGVDAGPTDDAVHVRRFMRHRTASGIEERPEDFTLHSVELFLLEGDALIPVEGRAGGPGEYVFPDVPRATYYLKVGTTYVVTDARSIDLSINKLGRPDIQALKYPSIADLFLRGLDPWYPYRSSFELVSEELGFMANIAPDGLEPGQEYALSTADIVLGTAVMPRFEEARGDGARVIQVSPHELSGVTLPDGSVQSYNSAVRSLRLPPFSHDGTQALPINGTLEPLSMQEFPLDWKVSAFASHATEVNPAAALRGPSFRLYPAAHGLADGRFGFSGVLLDLERPIGLGSDVSGSLAYGNPYPADWGLVASYSAPFKGDFKTPAGRTITVMGGMGVSHRLPAGSTGPIVPRILPPRSLRLDGTECYNARTVSTGAHVIEWQPPPGASASAYVVTLLRRDTTEGSGFIVEIDSRFQTDGSATSLQLPAGLLQPNKQYAFTVRAVLAEGYVPDRPLMLNDLPEYSYADGLSGPLTTSAPTP
jgi:hypothetical protein